MTRPAPRTPGPQARDERKARSARVRSSALFTIEGPLPIKVSMPDAYVGDPKIEFDAGPIHLAFTDQEAVFSFAEGLYELLRVAQRAYPNLDALLKEQRQARMREGRREVDPEARARVNGGMTHLERAMERAHQDAVMTAEFAGPIKAELAAQEQARLRER